MARLTPKGLAGMITPAGAAVTIASFIAKQLQDPEVRRQVGEAVTTTYERAKDRFGAKDRLGSGISKGGIRPPALTRQAKLERRAATIAAIASEIAASGTVSTASFAAELTAAIQQIQWMLAVTKSRSRDRRSDAHDEVDAQLTAIEDLIFTGRDKFMIQP